MAVCLFLLTYLSGCEACVDFFVVTMLEHRTLPIFSPAQGPKPQTMSLLKFVLPWRLSPRPAKAFYSQIRGHLLLDEAFATNIATQRETIAPRM